ncbi:MAG: hypothetical protein AAGA56_27495 [Myxococcota bacterium]
MAETSIKDPRSPFASRGCRLKHHLRHKTGLDADCRCSNNRTPKSGLDPCKRPYDAAKSGVVLGGGPSFARMHNAHLSGGFVDRPRNRLIASVYWSGSSNGKGLIVSYDLKTWRRRFISGDYEVGQARKTAGSGPAFDHLKDVKPGSDGKWYGLSYKSRRLRIFRIEPRDGRRSVVWEAGDPKYGQCPSGTPDARSARSRVVQYTHEGFAVDRDGSFLLGYANPIRDGRGIVRVSKDGRNCAYLTASGNRKDGLKRGSGPEMRGFVQGFTLHHGSLWAFTTGEKKLWQIDPRSGDRKVAASRPLGERHNVWDTKRKGFWTSGFLSSVTLGAFDPQTKQFMNVFRVCCKGPSWFPLCAQGPIVINSLNYGPVFALPNGNLALGQDSVGLVEFEPETGNSMIRSL